MRHVLISAIVGMTLMTATQTVAADGQAIYTANCGDCHNLLKPKLGDKQAWDPLIKQGEDVLVAAVIKLCRGGDNGPTSTPSTPGARSCGLL